VWLAMTGSIMTSAIIKKKNRLENISQQRWFERRKLTQIGAMQQIF